MSSTARLSETYEQLFKLFETLEKANFEPGIDFGENLTGCFQWFVAPGAITYLEQQESNDFWEALKQNKKVVYRLEIWPGLGGKAASISLK